MQIYISIGLLIVYLIVMRVEEEYRRSLPYYKEFKNIERDYNFTQKYLFLVTGGIFTANWVIMYSIDIYAIFSIIVLITITIIVTVYTIRRYKEKHIYLIKKTNRSLFRVLDEINPEDGTYEVLVKDFGVVELIIPSTSYHMEKEILKKVSNTEIIFRRQVETETV